LARRRLAFLLLLPVLSAQTAPELTPDQARQDAGIAPDVAVTRTFAARAAGRAQEMEVVLALIAALQRR
jgi:hypothetical protein